jgi:sentrin-specific protease 8
MDFDNLSSAMWLNDNNISFIFEYLERTYMPGFNTEDPGKILLIRPSMAYMLMHSPDSVGLKGVIPPLEKAHFVFFPINDNPDVNLVEGGAHWSLLVLDVAAKRALYYDTLQNSNYEYAHKTTRGLARYLNETLQLTIEDAPQQANGSDCGILVCEMTAILVRRLVAPGADESALKLKGLRFVPSAGRSFMETLVLDAYTAGHSNSC